MSAFAEKEEPKAERAARLRLELSQRRAHPFPSVEDEKEFWQGPGQNDVAVLRSRQNPEGGDEAAAVSLSAASGSAAAKDSAEAASTFTDGSAELCNGSIVVPNFSHSSSATTRNGVSTCGTMLSRS